MKTRNLLLAVGLLGAAISLPMTAGAYDSRVHYADVTQVIPIQQTHRISYPSQECRNEQIVHREGGRSYGGALAGGAVGGIAGSRFGGGRGQTAATVAGALLGAAVGDQLTHRPERSYTTTERVCETVDRWYDEERTVGYRVQYRFRGDTYWTEMDYHPGDTIRVRHDVTPLGKR